MKTVYRPDGRPALSPSASPRSACADGPVCLIVQSLSAPRRLCVCHRALLRLIAASCKAQLRPPAILFLHPSLVVCLLSCLAHALPFSQEARADVPWLHHRKFPVPVPDPSKSGTRKSPSYMNYHNAAKPSTAAPCPGRCRRWQHAQKFHNRLARLLLDVVKCIHNTRARSIHHPRPPLALSPPTFHQVPKLQHNNNNNNNKQHELEAEEPLPW